MNLRTSISALIGGLSLAIALACGGGGDNPPAPAGVSVSVSPTAPSMVVSGTQTFTATVSGSTNTAVTWTVQEGATGGAITSGGLYTAPASTGTYHVIATSVADISKSAKATLTVTAAPVVAVTVSPATPSVVVSGTRTFTATVTGSSNTAVTWSVLEAGTGGTITSGGVYTAPASTGTYHVIATSVADTSKSATATVTVTAAPVVAVTVSPTTPTLLTNGTQTFTATVTGSANTAVTWSVQEGATGGAITTGGVYTAPAAAGTYHVIATSVADTGKSATATVAVTSNVAIVLSYTNPTTGAYRLMKNDTLSTATHLVLDLTGVGASSGAGIAFTLTVDTARVTWVKVNDGDAEYVENGAVLNLGTAPLALKGKVATTTLTGVVGQKGTGSSLSLNGALARVALDLKPFVSVGAATLASPKARILAADGTITDVTVTPGTLTAN